MNTTVVSKIIKPDQHALLYTEWLVANGLGGYASGSLCNAPMRKYHALFIPALPAPYGRTVMLNYVADTLVLSDKKEIPLSLLMNTYQEFRNGFPLSEFRLEDGLPIWRYEIGDIILEKSLFLIHRQNTVHINYTLISSKGPLEIKWKPFVNFRLNEQSVHLPLIKEDYTINCSEPQHYEIIHPHFPVLRMYNENGPFLSDPQILDSVFYEIEARRGYESVGSLFSPGHYIATIQPFEKITFIVSTEPWNILHALSPNEAFLIEKQRRKRLLRDADISPDSGTVAKLALAADQFIITPKTRQEDMIRLQAGGEEARSVIAGFPWFTDWGRDTMISLEGLTLTTGRFKIASSILHTFYYYIQDGLIPNMFPEGEKKGLYNTADATLWFFHAVDRYIEITGDRDILEFLLPKFHEIIAFHLQGTRFGIRADHDGLLTQGEQGLALTWMDAKVSGWVVTPRRGKTVEINALWYNALKLMESWTGKPFEIAEKCYASFNQRFWYEKGQYLYDLIDGEKGDDPALRPNQIFSISLKYPILDQSRWKTVLNAVEKDLLTPVGLRTLSPTHPNYKAFYEGDLRSRDAAYHQGTVWPWLLGPFIDAWLKVYPNDYERAASFLSGLEEHLETSCIGTIAEIFDARDSRKARGCFAQAWSVAEYLRTLIKVKPGLKKGKS